MEIFQNIWFFMKKHPYRILVSFGAVIVLFLIIVYTNSTTHLFGGNINLDSWWAQLLDPFIGVGTFIVASIIALQNLNNSVKDSFEKRLTVHFVYDGNFIMTCHEAFLADKGDIRAWGQQIGGQMANNRGLDMLPYITNEGSMDTYPDKENPEGKLLYVVTFYLRTLPVLNGTDPNKDNDPNFFASYYKVWIDNQDDEGERSENREFIFSGKHKMCKSIRDTDLAIQELANSQND